MLKEKQATAFELFVIVGQVLDQCPGITEPALKQRVADRLLQLGYVLRPFEAGRE